jgi:DoxX
MHRGRGMLVRGCLRLVRKLQRQCLLLYVLRPRHRRMPQLLRSLLTPLFILGINVVYLGLACRCAVGVVFLVSASGKLRSRPAFRAFASWLAVLPVPLVRSQPRAAAGVMAAAETLIVVLVALPWTVRPGLALAAAVLAVFTAGTWLAVARGADAPCQCFGVSASPLGWRHGVRDALLGAIAVVGAVAAGSGGARPAAAAVGLGAGLVAAGFVVFLDDLAVLFTRTGETVPGLRVQ